MKKSTFILCFALLSLGFATKSQLVKKGNEAYKDKRYQTALENYQTAQIKNPDSSVIRFNTANALYELSEYRDAERAFDKIISQRTLEKEDKDLLAKSLYNYGNVQYRLGQFDKAMEAYKKVLDLNPQDADAKYNLELLQEMKKAFDKKNSERQKQKKDQPKQQPKQQQQQQNQNQQGGGQNEQQDKKDQKQQQENKGQGNQEQQQEEQKQDQSDKEKQSGQNEEQQSRNEKKDAADKKQEGEAKEKQKADRQKGEEEKRQDETPMRGQELTPYELSQLEQQPSQQNESDNKQETPQSSAQSLQGVNVPPSSKISKQQAMQILNALYESEKEVLNMRRPPVKPHEKTVTKDW